jgi:hypothetical protein
MKKKLFIYAENKPSSRLRKIDAEEMQSKIYQNYIDQFHDKGNVIAELVRVNLMCG